MSAEHPRDLPLSEARSLIARAIDKAEQLRLRGGVAVVGASGALVSASRMDRGGLGGMARARSKAWIAATQQIPSAEHLERMKILPRPIVEGFVACSPEARFPGAGGMPIRVGEHVVAGIAASGATVSPFFPDGVEPEEMIADGQPANPEDLLIHYALRIPYVGQHGDDHARWNRRFGGWPADTGSGKGMSEAPSSSMQSELRWAIDLADRAIAEARRRDVRIAVTIADRRGDAIQQDAMDGAAAGGIFVSEGTAAAAATFHCPSEQLAEWYPASGEQAQLIGLLPFEILVAKGGVPLVDEGEVVGGIGIGGTSPEVAAEIATAVAGDAA